jgi:hypothetical protein
MIQGIGPHISGRSSDQSTQTGHLSHLESHYKVVSIISGIGAAFCTAVLLAKCNRQHWHILGVCVQNTAWGTCWILTSFYLVTRIWNDAIYWSIRQQVCMKFCVNLGKSAMETVAIISKVFGEEGTSCRCLWGPFTFTTTVSFTSSTYQSLHFWEITGNLHSADLVSRCVISFWIWYSCTKSDW